jgi:hypothetical protein
MVHKPYFLLFLNIWVHPQILLRFESIFNFLCNICRSLYVFLSFFFRPLYCLFFDVPLVSSNFSSIQSLKMRKYLSNLDYKRTWWRLPKRRVLRTKFNIYVFITLYYHWVDTSAGGLFFSQGMIPAVVIASTLTCLIRYIAWQIKSIFRKIVQFVVQA